MVCPSELRCSLPARSNSKNSGVPTKIGELPMPAFDFDETMAARMFIPRAEGFTSNVPELNDGAYTSGFISNPLIDEDGIVRRTPLLHEYNNKAYESLALAMAATMRRLV